MPAQPTILRVSSLTGLAVFKNYAHTADAPEFRRHNLIYGFNGCGKTLLSRVFASVAEGSIRPELPAGGAFEVELTDGTVMRSAAPSDLLKGRLLVFNDDFIENNLRWKEGTANPVFYLGREQAELAQKLTEKEAELAAARLRHSEATTQCAQKEKAFADHKRDAARLIAEQLDLARRYDATNLSSDYAQGSYGDDLRLTEDERATLRALIVQDSPLPKRTTIEKRIALASLVREVRSVLEETVGSMMLADLRQHASMLRWLKEGSDYHTAHNLEKCLFCGNALTKERLAALSDAIDDRFERLTRSVAVTKTKAETLHKELGAIRGSLPSSNDISRDLRGLFTPAADSLRAALATGEAFITHILSRLVDKAAAPGIRIEPRGVPQERDADEWDAGTASKLDEFDALIEAHNKSHDEFSQKQSDARRRLKNHYLADGLTNYRAAETEAATSRTTLTTVGTQQSALQAEVERMHRELRKHGPAGGVIDRMVCAYLGHKELGIGTSDVGYEIRRNGNPSIGHLSEGEKTAIALCYFIATLEAEGRRLDNLIVVVDDPVSSLDTKALHHAFGMLKGALDGAGQLILMTHNLHFMNEAKKWLKKRAEDNKAALLFINAIQKPAETSRSSALVRLPKLIREYDSEYQYLFHLVLRFAEAQADADAEYFYLMPNALRKVLEIFLAFKLPGSDGLSNKVESILQGDYNMDSARIRALDRLVQLESHADNLDDLISFSSMTLEETKDAAAALLALMNAVDAQHFERLCRICR